MLSAEEDENHEASCELGLASINLFQFGN